MTGQRIPNAEQIDRFLRPGPVGKIIAAQDPMDTGPLINVTWDEEHLSLNVYVEEDLAGRIGFGGLEAAPPGRARILAAIRKAARVE